MPAILTQQTAIDIANQAAKDMSVAYPMSFVAVPSEGNHMLRLRIIHVPDERQTSLTLSHAKQAHGFSAECRRAIADMTKLLRDEGTAAVMARRLIA